MGDTNIDSAVASDLTNAMTDFSVASQSTDGAGDQKEFTYQNTKWTNYLGYYKEIPELKIAVDSKANWVMGNGFKADEETTLLLGTIKGTGKQSFNSILENMERTAPVAEDAYAEIIRENNVLVNIKILSPDSIVIVTGENGLIKRYEQVSRVKGKPNKHFAVEDIFVLTNGGMADEVHGESVIPAIKSIINSRNEAMTDWKRVLHRNIDPVNVFKLDTDDTVQIAAFKKKMDAARGNGENMYIPKGAVEVEPGGIPPNATLTPLQWIAQLNDYFFQVVGVPQIIIGNAKEFTDASAKIVYLAFEQRIKGRQLYVEEQILNQLNLEIELTFPASLQTDAVSDTPSETDVVEEEPIEGAAQPDDTESELEGQK